MNSRLLFTSTLTLALFWVIVPLTLTARQFSAVLVQANGMTAFIWLGVSLVLTVIALVVTGYGGRWRVLGVWAALLLCWIAYPLFQQRTLVLIQTEAVLPLAWLVAALIGTALLLLLIGQRMRAAAVHEAQIKLLLSIVNREMDEGMALVDSRLRVQWSNESARRYLIHEKTLLPEVEKLARRAVDTGRSASQSFNLDETLRVNLQATPQPNGWMSIAAHPLSYETGPNQFYERFIRRIVHDMRNPLAAIIAHASNLQDANALDPSSIATIEHEAQRLTRLVDSMLFDARLSYVPLALEQVDLRDIIEEVYYQHDERAMRENKSIMIESPPEKAPLEADRDLMVRALSNLVDNSLKYSPSGAEVRLSLDATADHYLLSVADTGDGIPPEYLPDRLFEPLVRARQKDSGSGLGLAIVRKIVQLHHGDISVESELGKGTTFTLCLPK